MARYDPPSPTNWVNVGRFDRSYAEAYNAGYSAASAGSPISGNPHEESGHERDTTRSDELHYWWHCGYWAFGETEEA
jgi:hypothetical protein